MVIFIVFIALFSLYSPIIFVIIKNAIISHSGLHLKLNYCYVLKPCLHVLCVALIFIMWVFDAMGAFLP